MLCQANNGSIHTHLYVYTQHVAVFMALPGNAGVPVQTPQWCYPTALHQCCPAPCVCFSGVRLVTDALAARSG